jgi:hypothetical protein
MPEESRNTEYSPADPIPESPTRSLEDLVKLSKLYSVRGLYANPLEWGDDLHANHQSPVRSSQRRSEQSTIVAR